MSLSLGRLGDVKRREGDVAGALVAYQESLDIFRKLAAQDQGNAQVQRDVALNLYKMSRVIDPTRARALLTEALSILEQSARLMARLLGHSRSTVSREISRNGGYDRYRAALADEQAWVRARRPKRCKLAKPATTTGSGEKAQIELVARADSRLAEESASRGWVLSRVT
jgi:hypothetical protein